MSGAVTSGIPPGIPGVQVVIRSEGSIEAPTERYSRSKNTAAVWKPDFRGFTAPAYLDLCSYSLALRTVAAVLHAGTVIGMQPHFMKIELYLDAGIGNDTADRDRFDLASAVTAIGSVRGGARLDLCTGIIEKDEIEMSVYSFSRYGKRSFENDCRSGLSKTVLKDRNEF